MTLRSYVNFYIVLRLGTCWPDLTLRCWLKGENATFTKSSNQQDRFAEPVLEGIDIATCCHHLCQWKSYVDKEFFQKLGFSIIDFSMIMWLTSWAVNEGGDHCAAEIDGSVDQKAMREESLQLAESDGRVKPRLSEALDSWDPAERAALGRRCKHILDHRRLLWLKQHGMDAKIVKYISSSVNPENKLLLAGKSLLPGSHESNSLSDYEPFGTWEDGSEGSHSFKVTTLARFSMTRAPFGLV